jgi:uncharacterized protein (DUF885 family)
VRSETELNEKFDLKEFHRQILKNGSVPLPVLEKEIGKYIAAVKLEDNK